MAAGAPDPAKALARRVNLLELLGDAHPEVPEPPEEARTDWTPEQIEACSFVLGRECAEALTDIYALEETAECAAVQWRRIRKLEQQR